MLDLSVVFLTQLAPSSSYPSRAELKALVHGAFVDGNVDRGGLEQDSLAVGAPVQWARDAMTDTVEDLVALMDLERLELDLFRGTGSGGETSLRIFGGHVVAQALAAAYRHG